MQLNLEKKISRRVDKLIENKEFKVLQRINLFFFPFFYFLMFIFILIEAYKYSGFLQKHILIGLRAILIIFVFSGIWAKLSLLKTKIHTRIFSYYQLMSSLNKLFFPAVCFIIFLLFSIENSGYSGYVYTQVIHLEPRILFFSFLVALFVLILDFDDTLNVLWKNIGIERTFFKTPKFLNLFLLVIIIWVFLGNMLKSFPLAYARLVFILKNPRLTYEEKMQKGWGEFYDYMMFIKENTPPDAAIMHPPYDPPWEKVGNGGLIRYFLYPRDEVYSFKGISDKGNKPTHMMIAYGWPDFPVEAEKLIYMPKTATESTETVYGNYDPEDSRNKAEDVLGIIELKRE